MDFEDLIQHEMDKSDIFRCLICGQALVADDLRWQNVTDAESDKAYCHIMIKCEKCGEDRVYIREAGWIDGLDGVLDIIRSYI